MSFISKSVRCVLLTAVALVGFGTCLEGRAQVVIAPATVIASPPINGSFSFDRTIDQSGLSTPYVSGVTDFETCVASSPTHRQQNSPSDFGLAVGNPPGNVDFDLGSVYDLDKMAFWNYGFNNSARVGSFEVYTSNDPTFSTSFLAGAFTALDDASGNVNHVQVFDLTDSAARYVRMRVLTKGANSRASASGPVPASGPAAGLRPARTPRTVTPGRLCSG